MSIPSLGERHLGLRQMMRKTHQRQQAMPNTPYDISVQVTIPPEFNKLAHVNIGYTAGIETTKVAPAWIEKANMMDKIIVPSTHSQNTFASTVYQLFNQQTEQHVGDLQVQTDFEVIPFPLRTTEPEELDINFETKFNFLTVSQISPRKNLETLVRITQFTTVTTPLSHSKSFLHQPDCQIESARSISSTETCRRANLQLSIDTRRSRAM
jgi:hypothetical protein